MTIIMSWLSAAIPGNYNNPHFGIIKGTTFDTFLEGQKDLRLLLEFSWFWLVSCLELKFLSKSGALDMIVLLFRPWQILLKYREFFQWYIRPISGSASRTFKQAAERVRARFINRKNPVCTYGFNRNNFLYNYRLLWCNWSEKNKIYTLGCTHCRTCRFNICSGCMPHSSVAISVLFY